MSAPRPPSRSSARSPARSSEHEREPGEPGEPAALDPLDEIEELGDDAIIAQQTVAHALQPRANVAEEARSVVITEHARRDTEPPRQPPPRSSAEATLVIRDRRALDEMRQKIVRRQQQKLAQGRNALYLWGGLGLAAFVLGGIVAFLATETHAATPTADTQPAAGDAALAHPVPPPMTPAPNASLGPRAVRLDDLPVEPTKKH